MKSSELSIKFPLENDSQRFAVHCEVELIKTTSERSHISINMDYKSFLWLRDTIESNIGALDERS